MKIVKREIVIDAPVSKVWKHVTDPEKISGWLMPNDFEAVVGKAFILDCAEQGKIACVVKQVIPEQKLVYSFTSKATKVETTVTITLVPEGNGTRVTLVHSGWDGLPPSDQGIADAFEGGWGAGLEKLAAQIAAASVQ